MQSVLLTEILELHVNVQNVVQLENKFVAVMGEHISTNVNLKSNLVRHRQTLELFIKANAVSSSNVKLITKKGRSVLIPLITFMLISFVIFCL